MANIIKFSLIVTCMVLVLTGCSGSGGPSTPGTESDPSDFTNPISDRNATESANNHVCLLYNLIYIDATDPNSIEYEIVPLRVTSMHLNILKFLEVGPCTDCFKIVGFNFPQPGVLDFDIEITHPFGELIFTIFDVRGIMMFDGGHVFPASGLTMSDSSMGDGELLNAEGYTQLYNGSTLGMAGDFFTYYKGNFATPTVPDADLNGFIRHITDVPANTRNALYPADSVTQTYSLALPAGEWVFGYAVDASWDIPLVDPVTDPMTDFPITANCIEPWKVEITEFPVGNGLTEEGGYVNLAIDVYDWQGKDSHAGPMVECPELFDGALTAAWTEDHDGFTRYEATVGNSKLASHGDYRCLISIEANENASSPEYLDLTAYQVIALTVSYGGGIVIFPDPVLEQKIREAINKPVGDIYEEDLLGLIELDASVEWDDPNKITDIEGIQFCINLETLDLSNNAISLISQLQYLTALTYLDLCGNYLISDITPLQNLTALTYLDLFNIEISDITPLQYLTALTYLDLGDNYISDITPLQNLTTLTYLDLCGHIYISDITPLQNLTALTYLDLCSDPFFLGEISDITPLQNLTALTYLDLGFNQISDITPIQNLTALIELDLGGNDISDITPLQNLTVLTYLNLSYIQISDITPLQNLTALIDLDLSSNSYLIDITPLQNLTALTYLDLSETWNLSDITPLQNLTGLTDLWLQGNEISDITPLQYLTALTYLDLGDNYISDITPLQNLTALIILNLGWNGGISDITPLQNLTGLTDLYLHGNQISDITPLQNLTALINLNLEGNQISDIYPLVLNSDAGGLGVGDEVEVYSNPLSDTSINVYIPHLQANGVIVYW